jgi:hypothetical protein
MPQFTITMQDGPRVEKMALTLEQVREFLASLSAAEGELRRHKDVIVWFDFKTQTITVETN